MGSYNSQTNNLILPAELDELFKAAQLVSGKAGSIEFPLP
jgi:SAM-dependent MidA family methyltransferase